MTTTLVGTTSNDTMIGGSGGGHPQRRNRKRFPQRWVGLRHPRRRRRRRQAPRWFGLGHANLSRLGEFVGRELVTSYDVYNGGTGAVQRGSALPDLDRLHIYLSEAQLDDPIFMAAFNADMCEYEAFLVAQTNPNTLQAGQTEFTFDSINLKVSAIEKVAVVKAGQTHDFLETDEAQSATGSLTSAGSAAFVAGSQSSHLGTFTVDAGGAWTFVMNDAHDHLADSETEGAIFNVLAEDGSTVTVTIVLTGTNDAPVLTIATRSPRSPRMSGWSRPAQRQRRLELHRRRPDRHAPSRAPTTAMPSGRAGGSARPSSPRSAPGLAPTATAGTMRRQLRAAVPRRRRDHHSVVHRHRDRRLGHRQR